MLNNKRIIEVMPAYNAVRTLRQTYSELPLDIIDDVLLVADGSADTTVNLASEIGLTSWTHCHLNCRFNKAAASGRTSGSYARIPSNIELGLT